MEERKCLSLAGVHRSPVSSVFHTKITVNFEHKKLEIEASDQNIKSDLIQILTGNGLKHGSGHVRSNQPPVTFI